MSRGKENILIKLLQKLLLSDRLTPAGITLLYAALSALWIVLSGYLLTLIVADPLLQSRIELAKGLAFVAVTSGLLYLLLNHWRESHAMQPAAVQTERTTPPKIIQLVLIFIALVLLVPLIGFVIYKLNIPQIEQGTYNNLNAIAKLKAEEIENWLNERRGDAQGVIADVGFARDVEYFLLAQKHDAGLLKQITVQLASKQVDNNFDSIMLLDTGGRLITSLGKNVGISQPIRNLLHESLNSKQIKFSDLYRDESGHINLDWVVPIIVSDRQGKHAVAAVVLRVAPDRFLYPLIQTWPSASASGETLLARREGGSVMLLNQPRQHKDAALTTHGSLNDPVHPTAIAIRENRPGTATGTDYRQVQVLAAYRPVTGTDWHLVAKIDRDEVMMPLWNLLYWIGVIASVAVGLIIALLLLHLRQSQRLHQVALKARSAESLRENNELLRLFIEHAPVALAMFDRKMRYLAFSLRWMTDYALGNQIIIGRSHYEVFPEISERWKALHARALAGEVLRCAEESFERMDGTVQWLKCEIWPWKTNDGDIGGILIFSEDIGEHKQMASALEQNATQLRTLVQTIPDLVWLKDTEGVYLSCNPMFERLYGAREADIIGKSDYDFVDKELADFFRKHDLKAMADDKPSINEEWLTFAENGYRGLFETIKTPMKDAKGNLAGVLGISRDITERKQAAQKVAESERYFRSLFENMLEGYAYCKMIYKEGIAEDFVYIDVNQAFETLTGLKDVCGKNVSEIIPGIRESNPELLDLYGRVALTGQPERFETYVAGLGIWFSISAYSSEKEYFVAVFDNITKRKQAEEELQISALKHRLLFESSRDALMILSPPSWKFTGANQTTAELFGASSVAEVTSLGPWDVSPEQQPDGRPSAEKAQEVIATAMREGSCLFEWEHRRLDGQPFIAEVLLTRMKLGEEVFLQATVRDISERKLAEKALQDSEMRYRRITEGLTDYQYTVRIENGRAVETVQSPACVAVTGYKVEEFSANPHLWIQMVVPEDRELIMVRVGQILAGKDVPPMEHRIVRKDGELRWVNDTTILFKDASGKLLSYDGVIKDITERKQAEESLRKLSQAVEQSPSTIVITDLNANIEYANTAFVKESGYSLAEAIGKNPRLLHSGKTPRSTYDDMWAHLTRGEAWKGEFINRRKDGNEYIELALISPVFQADGRMTNFLAIKENITERKAAEAKIRRLTQLYAALSQCNEAIVRCANEEELFPRICRDAVQFGGMQMVWIGMVDKASKQVRPVASYGDGSEYLDGIQISVDAADPFGHGPTGTAIRDNRPYWNQDFQLDPNTAPWQGRREKYGWKSSAALPLLRNGTPVGSITLYSDTVNAFDEEARKLLAEMSMDISFALDNFAREATRKHGEQELLDSEQRFRGLVEQSLAGIYIIQDGKLVYVNPRCAEILGQGSADKLIGQSLMQYIVVADRVSVMESMRRLLDKEVRSITAEYGLLHKDGVTITVGANASLATYHGQPAIIGMAQDISEKKRAEEQISNYVARLKAAFLSTVQMATSLSEMRDPYTAGHERRVAEIAVAIATTLGWDEQRIEGLRIAGYLHDIGKISIPAEILVKPGRLTATEYALVQGHAQASYEVLKHVEFPWPVAAVALQHHERMDGSGYPNQLKGDEIMLESRIMAVADVVEAMASHRPYRPGLGIDKALAEIERGSGTLYDPMVADACLCMFREQGFVLPPY